MTEHFTLEFVHPHIRYEQVKYLEGSPISHNKLLGGGTYGEVYEGSLNNFPIAVKRNIVERSIDNLGTIRELDILARCKHPFIVNLEAIFLSNPFKNFILPEITQFKTNNGMVNMSKPVKIPAPHLKEDPLFFGFESAAYDFNTFIYDCGERSWSYIKKAMTQLLIGMKWLRAKGIIHRDLKPGNLLWQRDGSERFLKICDFGMSKHMYETGVRSDRVVTSWYRAPEISFGYPYSYPSDMWSVGCILFEIVTKNPLNNKIEDDNVKLLENSLCLITEVPDRQLINKMNKEKLILNEKIYSPRNGIASILNSRSNDNLCYYDNCFDKDGLGTKDQFADLLNHLLVLDPVKRYTAEQCLEHPFFYHFRNYTKSVEKLYPPIEPVYEQINIVECKDRSIAVNFCYEIYDNETEYPWYKPQILFHTIELYDKYLTHMQKNNFPYYEVGATPAECRYESEKMVTFKVLVCLYICIKYFTITKVAGRFTDITSSNFHTPEYMQLAKDFECGLIINLLKYQIYRPTILEASDYYRFIPQRGNIKYMLLYYGNLKGGVYENYRSLFPGYQEYERRILEEKRMSLFNNPNNVNNGNGNNVNNPNNGNNVNNNGNNSSVYQSNGGFNNSNIPTQQTGYNNSFPQQDVNNNQYTNSSNYHVQQGNNRQGQQFNNQPQNMNYQGYIPNQQYSSQQSVFHPQSQNMDHQGYISNQRQYNSNSNFGNPSGSVQQSGGNVNNNYSNQQNYVPNNMYNNNYPNRQNYNPNNVSNNNYPVQQNYNPNNNYPVQQTGSNSNQQSYPVQQNYNPNNVSNNNYPVQQNYNPNQQNYPVQQTGNNIPQGQQSINNNNNSYKQQSNSQVKQNINTTSNTNNIQQNEGKQISPNTLINRLKQPGTPGTPITSNVNKMNIPKQNIPLKDKQVSISTRPKISIVHTTQTRYVNPSSGISPGTNSNSEDEILNKIMSEESISPIANSLRGVEVNAIQ